MIAHLQDGSIVDVELGVVEKINGSEIVFSVEGNQVVIEVNDYTLNLVLGMLEHSEFLMLPIHTETNSVLLDLKVDEEEIEELKGSMYDLEEEIKDH